MDFPIIRRAKQPDWNGNIENGWVQHLTNGHTSKIDLRIPHTPEKDLAGGANWVVQKYGGTSVGKFPVKIAEEIVMEAVQGGRNRVAIVCSARSTETKSEGTTNRLLRAARDVEKADSRGYVEIVEAIRRDHVVVGERDVLVTDGKGKEILDGYVEDVGRECANLIKILESAQFLKAVTEQTKDMVMSVGEKLSCLYMTAILQSRGVPAVYIDMSEVVTFEKANSVGLGDLFYDHLARAMGQKVLSLGTPDDESSNRSRPTAIVPVITGYFGQVPGGLLEQIGRGYTDLCAALVGIGLRAHELQIWKEVDGIFTADPRKVSTARLLPSVSPSEAAELTFYGSEVIHPFTMDQVIKALIPIRIKNVQNPRNEGTVIHPDPRDDYSRRPGFLFRDRSTSSLVPNGTSTPPPPSPRRPTAVTIKKGIAVLNVHSKQRTRAHGFLSRIFSTLDAHGLSVDLISSSEVHISLALHSEIGLLSGGGEDEMRISSAALRSAVDDLSKWGDIDLVPKMAIISLVGKQLRSLVGISGKFFSVLGGNGINIEMISQGASEINISCVIEEGEADRALNVVHTELFTFSDG